MASFLAWALFFSFFSSASSAASIPSGYSSQPRSSHQAIEPTKPKLSPSQSTTRNSYGAEPPGPAPTTTTTTPSPGDHPTTTHPSGSTVRKVTPCPLCVLRGILGQDTSPMCPTWACIEGRSQCTENLKYMAVMCQRSCGTIGCTPQKCNDPLTYPECQPQLDESLCLKLRADKKARLFKKNKLIQRRLTAQLRSTSLKNSSPVEKKTRRKNERRIPCVDKHRNCGKWARVGYCRQPSVWMIYMVQYCPKACGHFCFQEDEFNL